MFATQYFYDLNRTKRIPGTFAKNLLKRQEVRSPEPTKKKQFLENRTSERKYHKNHDDSNAKTTALIRENLAKIGLILHEGKSKKFRSNKPKKRLSSIKLKKSKNHQFPGTKLQYDQNLMLPDIQDKHSRARKASHIFKLEQAQIASPRKLSKKNLGALSVKVIPLISNFKSSPGLNPRSSTYSNKDLFNKSHKDQSDIPSPKEELKNLMTDQNEYILDMGEDEEKTVKYIQLKDKTQVQLFVNNCIKKGIMPNKHCFNPKREKKDGLNLQNMYIGDHFAQALAETLPYHEDKYSLSLSQNRLSQKGANAILEKMSPAIQSLDISYNPSVKDLDTSLLIIDYKYKLRELNLEGNNVGDQLVIKLCDAIIERPFLESLNLSHNLITNKGAIALGNLLSDNESLTSLFLRWNNILNATELFEALQNNE